MKLAMVKVWVPVLVFMTLTAGTRLRLEARTAQPRLHASQEQAKQQTYEMKIDFDRRVKMRDGTELSADVYHPDAPGKFPVILQRTSYGRSAAFEAAFYARRGYVFVAQDVRGKFALRIEASSFPLKINPAQVHGGDAFRLFRWKFSRDPDKRVRPRQPRGQAESRKVELLSAGRSEHAPPHHVPG